MLNIKVCGITILEQLYQLDKLFVDYAGFVFNKKSNQNVIGKIQAEELKYADVDIKKVGVFCNTDYNSVLTYIKNYGLDLIQLNGAESPELCKMLSKEIAVIKTFNIDNFDSHKINSIINAYDDAVDYYSFDVDINLNNKGISNSIDWNMIGKTSIEKPFFIGGAGVKPSDAPMIHQFKHPDFFGVDLNDNFEKISGQKDTSLIVSFINALNQVVN